MERNLRPLYISDVVGTLSRFWKKYGDLPVLVISDKAVNGIDQLKDIAVSNLVDAESGYNLNAVVFSYDDITHVPAFDVPDHNFLEKCDVESCIVPEVYKTQSDPSDSIEATLDFVREVTERDDVMMALGFERDDNGRWFRRYPIN